MRKQCKSKDLHCFSYARKSGLDDKRHAGVFFVNAIEDSEYALYVWLQVLADGECAVEFDDCLFVVIPAKTQAVPKGIQIMAGVVGETELLFEQFVELVIISDFGEINDDRVFGDRLIHVIFDGMFVVHDDAPPGTDEIRT